MEEFITVVHIKNNIVEDIYLFRGPNGLIQRAEEKLIFLDIRMIIISMISLIEVMKVFVLVGQ